MHTSVKIMDIDVDILTSDTFIEKIDSYLSDAHLNVIFFISTELLNMAMEDEEYRGIIEKATLLLPGEEPLLTAHHVDVLEAGGIVVSCKSFGKVLENLNKQDRSIYILAKSEKEVLELQRYCMRMQRNIRLTGSSVYGDDVEDAAIVNDINSNSPDMLLVDLPLGRQEKWIVEHVPLLNSKLCIAIGGVAGLILAEGKKTPDWVKRFHLEWFFQILVREQRVKKGFRARIFRKRIVQYNNQMEDEENT